MSFLREPNAEPIPGYRLIEPLGSGGFGEAWKCEAPGGLHKAIKFVFGNLNSLDMDGARAEQELKALNRIKEVRHPFILSMDRIEVVDGELVIVMELADRNLHDAYEECQSAGLVGVPREQLLRYVRDAAEALDHMNEKHSLQHLDVKPRNLFLVSDRVKVADFGLVKTLERSAASGVLNGVTPLYAPPETYSGQISDRSDQYSLAIVYQELLTGQRPFAGKNARQLAQQHLHEEPDLRGLPEAERAVIARALSKDPAKRFPNCLALVRALYTASAPLRLRGTLSEDEASAVLDDMALGTPSTGRGSGVRRAISAPAAEPEVSQLGMTVAQPATGSLRPTLVLGVGGTGRRALLELRCRLVDRFGDLDKLPLLRFVYIDTDGEALKESQRGAPEVAFRAHEVYHLPLQAVSHYRRRQLDQITDWLPREKLYALPRSLKTQGSRALGRLAFADNHMRLTARLRREIQQACHPDAVYQTVAQTGLALRDSIPRIYVLGAASGGSSGFLPDLGYAVRRIAQQLNHTDAPVNCLLMCGAPDDPATPRTEQANLYATLTELNHFTDAYTPFSAQYASDGPRLVDEGSAYDATYLLAQEHRTPADRRDALSHLASYLFHELTTPLGLRLDQCRQRAAAQTPFRSLGTYGVWFPRGLLLRLAARSACQRLLDEWQAPGPVAASAELEAVQARVLADPELVPESLAGCIAELAAGPLDGSPRDLLTRLLAALEEQSLQGLAQDDPAAWARQALARVQEWLGSGLRPPGTSSIQQRKSRLTRALETAAGQLAEEWERRFSDAALGLMEHPGRRVALAETALQRFMRFVDAAAAAQHEHRQKQEARSSEAQAQLQTALENCVNGSSGWSWFGSRSRRLLRVFIDHLAAFGRQCLADDLSEAVHQFFVLLRGRLDDRLRDLGTCRMRLRHMLEVLGSGEWGSADEDEARASDLSPTPLLTTESFWEAIRASTTTRVVLPDGERDLERAAQRFLKTLGADQWGQLDQAFGDQVLAPRGGLHKACMGTNDLVRHLAAPLVTLAASCLGDQLPITDVAQVEASLGSEDDLLERIFTYHARSTPPLRARARQVEEASDRTHVAPAAHLVPESSFLLVPGGEWGKGFGERSQQAVPGLHLVNVPGQADLMFCREQNGLSLEDLEPFLASCRDAYHESARLPQTSPHARFDIQDWTPLDP